MYRNRAGTVFYTAPRGTGQSLAGSVRLEGGGGGGGGGGAGEGNSGPVTRDSLHSSPATDVSCLLNNNTHVYSNRLFMAPPLVRDQSA